ncbi:DNA-binding MarR family transcriptional regulator [Spinactinospora alkalitolerans]|uniref:DNA-binding MarR family transcriptional regulator n=1 Tax=Spinactinospora alkalitolerans TaxID=687207 RepID=A0A852TT58_9ACTN|nr:MarR family winged helix-turn-helix transcriptional regulator [Spinactinospora alkalitolerans]NYE47626.1 DNA-binding MarR family transcriptional regulator [Spinactinospora alkalitolerans]
MHANQPLTEDLGFLLSRASGVLARSASEALAPLGLRVRSYSVLDLVGEDGGGVTQRRLAATMGLDPSQIVALVDDLESRGLVTRTPDPADRRNKLIVNTEQGHRLRGEAQQQVEQAHIGYFARISQSDLDRLRRLLQQIAFPDGTSTAQTAEPSTAGE